ncbi:MAG TPA: DUF6797 domain-containing protein [Planctomycetota bacterium]|nr:DUF6797 domain-containing protein [Planctomycetota bacterium]
MRSAGSLVLVVCGFLASSLWAGQGGKPIYDRMDYGPFLAASILSEPTAEFDNGTGNFTIGKNKAYCDVTVRGIAIRLTDDWNAGIVFDADACRMSAGWIGGPLKFRGLIGNGDHGPSPTLSVPPSFQVLYGPGWADKNGSFKDPREDYIKPLPPPGNLPADWAKYKGLYLHGNQVILSYTVGTSTVLESASLETAGDVKAFARTITLGPSAVAQKLAVADVLDRNEKHTKEESKDKNGKVTTKDIVEYNFTPASGKVDNGIANVGVEHAAVVGAPAGAALEVVGNKIVLNLPARKNTVTFKVLVAAGGDASKASFAALAKASSTPADLTALTSGGPGRWKDVIETVGVLGKPGPNDSYTADKLTIPYKNVYDSWMRTAAFDFFADGTRAAVSTWSGDVWIVSGIDESLAHLKWKRFATGLHQPLGLKIVDDQIYVLCRDEICKLHDLNNDGEADFYECINHDWHMTTAFHAFAFDLQTDPQGNFFFAFGSPVKSGGGGFHRITKDHGTIIKVSKDGTKKETYATGVRAPNGMCVSPTGQVTIGDNEGTWVPSSPLHWVKQGSFLGVQDSAHGAKLEQPKPLLWLPHNSEAGSHGSIDNSCGGQAWVTSDKWGPYKDYLLHLSYGTSSLFLVMPQEVDGQMQGAAIRIPVNFTSSAMRPRFNPKDGQLYIVGLRGWQTNAGNDGGFDRVRYTGKPVHMPATFKATAKGVELSFTTPLDKALADDAQNFMAEGWNYLYTGNYGSPEVKLDGSKKHGHDPFTVKSTRLSSDGKTVFLEIPDLKPCMQFKIKYNLKGADGIDMKQDVYGTIYNLPQ